MSDYARPPDAAHRTRRSTTEVYSAEPDQRCIRGEVKLVPIKTLPSRTAPECGRRPENQSREICGLAAFFTLIGLQYVIAWMSVRFTPFQTLIKSEPRMLLFEGRLLENEMRAEHVTREEVIAAIRAQGIPRIEDVGAVVLETDGTFATLRRTDDAATTLETVSNADRRQTLSGSS